jgi:hypothetical protein
LRFDIYEALSPAIDVEQVEPDLGGKCPFEKVDGAGLMG